MVVDAPANENGPPCPNCGKPATPAFRPFCSKRCADVDLNRWLKGSYAIPVEDDGPGEPSDEADPGPRV